MNRVALFQCCLAFWCGGLFAQTQPGQLAPNGRKDGVVKPTQEEPLTRGQKFRLAVQRSVEPTEFARIAIGAAFDQARTYPEEWGQGWDAFGVRVASGFGQHLIKEQIEFAVWSIDGEDPRHRRSGLHGVWPRTRYAVVHTFVARRDDGRQMPAISRFVGDYGGAFISRQWYPTRFHTIQQGFDAGTVSLGVDVGMSVLREFLPERLIH